MATANLSTFLRRLTRGMVAETLGDLSDRRLVEQLLAGRDEAAFEAVVRRHGPMVYRVCWRVLQHSQDTEDAFQATFLLLARKLGGVRKRDSLASWLHGVAHRVALKAKAQAGRRRRHERLVCMSPAAPPDDITWRELRTVLDAELVALPERLRLPLILCYLEGRSQEEAAGQLGLSKRTLLRRLQLARAALGRRLTRRGVVWSSALSSVLLSDCVALAAPATELVSSTVEAAARVAAGQAAVTGLISAKVAALTEGMVNVMVTGQLRAIAAVLVLASAVTMGTWFLASGGLAAQPEESKPAIRQTAGDQQPVAGAKARDQLQAAAVLKDAKEAAKDIDDKQWKAWTLQAIAVEQAKAGDKTAAARTFREAIEAAKEIKSDNAADPTGRTRHTMIYIAEAQADAGDIKGAFLTAESVEDVLDARESAFAYIAGAQARSGDIQGALKTIKDLSTNMRKDSALHAVAAAQAKVGKVTEAAQTVEAIGSDPWRARSLAMLAKAQFEAKDADAARKTLKTAVEIASRIEQGEDGSWRAGVYGYLAQVQAEMGDLKAARQTIDGIATEPWKSIGLINVVAAQASRGDIKGASQTAEAIEQEYQRGEAGKEVVMAQLRSGDLKGAVQTADAVKSVFWRVAILAEIAKAQAKAGNGAAAAETFKKAFAASGKDAGDVRDDEPGRGGLRNAVLCVIVRAQAEAGQENEALAWAMNQSPLLKAQALLNIARGVAARKAPEKPSE